MLSSFAQDFQPARRAAGMGARTAPRSRASSGSSSSGKSSRTCQEFGVEGSDPPEAPKSSGGLDV